MDTPKLSSSNENVKSADTENLFQKPRTASLTDKTSDKKSRKRSRSGSPVSQKKLLSFISPASALLVQSKSSSEKKSKSKRSDKTKSDKAKRKKSKKQSSKKSKRSRAQPKTAPPIAAPSELPLTPKDTPPASPPAQAELPTSAVASKQPPEDICEEKVAVSVVAPLVPLGHTPPEPSPNSPSSPGSDVKPATKSTLPSSFALNTVAGLRGKVPLKKVRSTDAIPAGEYEQLRKEFSKKIVDAFRSSKPHSRSRILTLAEVATKKAYLYKSTEKILAKQMDKMVEGNFEGVIACLYLVDAIVSRAKKEFGKSKEKFSDRLLPTVMKHLNRTMEMQLPPSLSTKAMDLIAEKTIEMQRIKKEALRLVNNWLEKKAFRDLEGQLLSFRKKWLPQFPATKTDKFHPSFSVKTKKLRLNIPKELEVTESPPSPPRSLSPVPLPPALPLPVPALNKPMQNTPAFSVMVVNKTGLTAVPPPPPLKNASNQEVDSLESRVKALSGQGLTTTRTAVVDFQPPLLPLPAAMLMSVPPPPNGILQPLPPPVVPFASMRSGLPVYNMLSQGLLPLPVGVAVDNSQLTTPVASATNADELSAFYNDIKTVVAAPKNDQGEVRNVPLTGSSKPATVPQVGNSLPQRRALLPPVPDPVGTEADWRRWCGFGPKPRGMHYSVVTRTLHVRVLPKDCDAARNKAILCRLFSRFVVNDEPVDVVVDPYNNFAVITMENRARAHQAKREILGNPDVNRNKQEGARKWDAELEESERFIVMAIRSGRMQLDW
ncbi:uncharacterized protein LOC129585726 isoform X2 [Paramacrobiotus metropolitanus]|nr:uncharacterized protein LOC129585726 isoform X2 [Paramacrobiotus metropolitanus]